MTYYSSYKDLKAAEELPSDETYLPNNVLLLLTTRSCLSKKGMSIANEVTILNRINPNVFCIYQNHLFYFLILYKVDKVHNTITADQSYSGSDRQCDMTR